MAEADVVVHVDAASIVPGNYRVLNQLASQPQIKASPELAKMVQKAVAEVEGGRGLLKSLSGIDVTTDVSDATLFVQITAQNKPNIIATVRGRFSTQNIDKIAGQANKQATKAGGGAMIEMGGNDPAIAVTKDGVLLIGTPALVRERLADTWKRPARPANSHLANVAGVIDGKPVLAVSMALSAAARQKAIKEMGGKKNFISDLLQRHKFFALAMYHDGLGWTWVDSTKAGLDAMGTTSEGMMELLRAAQIAPRGIAKIMMGALESYRGDKRVDELLRRKTDLWKIVESYTGDGNFKVAIDKNPATLRLTARATGKSLSEVVPAGMVIPLGMVGFLVAREGSDMPPPSSIAVPPPTPIRPTPRPTPRPAPQPTR
jgi:hypothetical protein